MENLWAEAEMDGETERWERDREGSVCMAWMASGLMWVTACSFSVSLRDDEHCSFWTLREGASQKGPGPEPCTALWNCKEQAGSRGICMNSYMHILARIWCQGDLGLHYVYRILVPGWPWHILCVQGKAEPLTQFRGICWPWSHIDLKTHWNSGQLCEIKSFSTFV